MTIRNFRTAMSRRTITAALSGLVALMALCAWSDPAAADFRLCNNTSSRVGIALGYFLFIYGISHVEAGAGSMAFFLKPFLAALFAWMVLGEALTVPMLIGGAFILGGMIVALARIPAR